MAFNNDEFALARPYLFHLTHRKNLPNIKSQVELLCAETIMRLARNTEYLRQKRCHSLELPFGSTIFHVRDQAPLHGGNIAFEGKWKLEDLIQSLNEKVFFWPGTESGPNSYGQRHFARYANENPVILKISTGDLFRTNSSVSPLYCRFNSGSPRWSRGLASKRGPHTFIDSAKAPFGIRNVVEVTFVGKIKLPKGVQVGDVKCQKWVLL
ncbi:MAG: hypothetical protein QM703_26325 [Gemmatales bacterium]